MEFKVGQRVAYLNGKVGDVIAVDGPEMCVRLDGEDLARWFWAYRFKAAPPTLACECEKCNV